MGVTEVKIRRKNTSIFWRKVDPEGTLILYILLVYTSKMHFRSQIMNYRIFLTNQMSFLNVVANNSARNPNSVTYFGTEGVVYIIFPILFYNKQKISRPKSWSLSLENFLTKRKWYTFFSALIVLPFLLNIVVALMLKRFLVLFWFVSKNSFLFSYYHAKTSSP